MKLLRVEFVHLQQNGKDYTGIPEQNNRTLLSFHYDGLVKTSSKSSVQKTCSDKFERNGKYIHRADRYINA